MIVWDAARRSAVKVAPISTDAGVARRKVVRAATTSSFATNHCARAIAYSPNAQVRCVWKRAEMDERERDKERENERVMSSITKTLFYFFLTRNT